MTHPSEASRKETGAASEDSFVHWFMRDSHWSRAGLPLAVVLLALGPVVRRGLGRAAFLVYLQLPVYMLHQYEEHAHGAFKRSANHLLAGRGRLTDRKIFWINMLGVWVADLGVLYLARFVRPVFGLVAAYLAIVNGLIHLAFALRERQYNPGLWTGLGLLLPIGGCSAAFISRAARASGRDHLRSLGAVLVLHGVVVLSIIRGGRK